MRRVSSTVAAAIGMLLSRTAGLLRTALVVSSLGITGTGDAAAAAMRVPNVVQNLLGEGALTAAFVPEYARLTDRDPHEAGRLAGAVASLLMGIAALFVLVSVVFARPLTRAIAWGFGGERFELTVDLVRIFAASAALLVVSAWCLGVLNTHRRFFLSYVAPVLWNTVQIAVLVVVGLWGWTRVDRAHALAWAAVVGAAAQVLVQIPTLRRVEPNLRIVSPLRVDAARRVAARLGPAVAGRGALQLSAFIDLALASLLAAGATAALAAAQPLYILPISLIALSRSATELPELSRDDDIGAVVARTSDRIGTAMYLMGFVVVTYLTAGDLVAGCIYQLFGLSDRVSDDSVIVIGLVLGAFTLGLPALTASRLLQNVMFSRGDTRTPARISLVRISVSFAVGVVLMVQLDRVLVYDGLFSGITTLLAPFELLPEAIREDDTLPLRLGAVGLALGASVGAWVEYVLIRRAALDLAGEATLGVWSVRTQAVPVVVAGTAAIALRWILPSTPIALETALIGGTIVVSHQLVGEVVGNEAARRLRQTVSRALSRRPSDG